MTKECVQIRWTCSVGASPTREIVNSLWLSSKSGRYKAFKPTDKTVESMASEFPSFQTVTFLIGAA